MQGTAAGRVEKYQFDDFELFPKPRVLSRAGLRIPLTPKPVATLLLLVDHAGETVSKEELFEQVWAGASVEENNLTQSISALRKALGEKRGENRYIITDPGRGYRFVAPVNRVLEESETKSGAADVAAKPLRGKYRSALILAAILSAATITVLVWSRRAATRLPGRQSIAVLRVRDLSKNSTESWLQTALPEMLTSELAAGGKLRTIPAEDVARWRADLGRAVDSESRAEMLRSARNNLGADTFVVGSYVVTGTCPLCRIRVDLGLLQARTGDRFGTIIDEGSAAELLDLTNRLGRRLRAELGLKIDNPILSRWPASSAMREYSEGLAALRQGDPIAAREHLEAAVAADSQNALIHSALAEAWTALGYSARANEEDRRAYELAGSLDRLDQLGVEARYRVSVKEWKQAIEIYKTVFNLFPDSLDDGLSLARAQWRAQRIADARSTLAELRRLPKPAGDDPRINLNEAQAVGTLNDFASTRALAHRAAEEAKARGARYLFARARLLEGGAMQSMNDSSGFAVQDEARQTCEAIGDRDCVSKAWRIRGNALFYKNDFQGALHAYSQGVAIARDLGNQAELANLLVGFAVVEKADRYFPQAERNLMEAISLKIASSYSPNEVRNELAELYISTGRIDDAGRLLQFAATTMEQSGAYEDFGDMLLLQSIVARMRGQLDRASQLGERALPELRRAGDPLIISLCLSELSSIYTAQGKLDLATKELEAAGARNIPESEGEIELARAELGISKGQFSKAAQDAKKAAAAFDRAHQDDRSTQAFVTAADALDLSNQTEDALFACHESEKRAALTPSEISKASAQICSWRLSPGNAVTAPAELQAKVAKLRSPELTLCLDYARVERARRSKAMNYEALREEFADFATRLGYVTLAHRVLH